MTSVRVGDTVRVSGTVEDLTKGSTPAAKVRFTDASFAWVNAQNLDVIRRRPPGLDDRVRVPTLMGVSGRIAWVGKERVVVQTENGSELFVYKTDVLFEDDA